jgi:hypothetical protein
LINHQLVPLSKQLLTLTTRLPNDSIGGLHLGLFGPQNWSDVSVFTLTLDNIIQVLSS